MVQGNLIGCLLLFLLLLQVGTRSGNVSSFTNEPFVEKIFEK